jgi:S-(hydroxymethyl)glutathione dehydrogenase/alcohol dehydrogenase
VRAGARTLTTLPSGALRTSDAQGRPLSVFSGCGVMAEYATLDTRSLIKIAGDAPLRSAALVGCGVMTGFCAVTNTARVAPGAVVVVLGAGGAGLSAIQGAAVAGARMVVAVDIDDFKLGLAKTLGATHTVNSKGDDAIVKTLRKLTGGGADYAFECVGSGELAATACSVLRKGGQAVVVAGAAQGHHHPAHRQPHLRGKSIAGSYFGSARPRVDAPRILGLYQAGKLKLDELITRTYPIAEAPQAFADLQAGRNARGVIVFKGEN